MSVSFFFEVALPAVGAACVLVTFLMAEWHHIAGFFAQAWRRVRPAFGGADRLLEAWKAGVAARRMGDGVCECRLADGSAGRHAWLGGWHETDAAMWHARLADAAADLKVAVQLRDQEAMWCKHWYGRFLDMEGRLKAAEKEASSLKSAVESELPALRAELEAAKAELDSRPPAGVVARAAALAERQACRDLALELSGKNKRFAGGGGHDPNVRNSVSAAYLDKAATCDLIATLIGERTEGV